MNTCLEVFFANLWESDTLYVLSAALPVGSIVVVSGVLGLYLFCKAKHKSDKTGWPDNPTCKHIIKYTVAIKNGGYNK